MIGKAKIFLYTLFSPDKHVPPVNFSTKWYHKCLLLLVRRSKSLKSCPEKITYFEWIETKKKAKVYWGRTQICINLMICFWIGLYMKKLDILKTNRDYEARIDKNLPLVPPFDLFGKNQFHDNYNSEYPVNYKY